MKMNKNNKIVGPAALLGLSLIAGSAVAGGIGSNGVSDEAVAQYAPGATVRCPAVGAAVPEDLFRRMDCGPAAAGQAQGVVAGARATNRPRGGILGFFDRYLNERRSTGHTFAEDDDDVSVIRISDDDNGDGSGGVSGDGGGNDGGGSGGGNGGDAYGDGGDICVTTD